MKQACQDVWDRPPGEEHRTKGKPVPDAPERLDYGPSRTTVFVPGTMTWEATQLNLPRGAASECQDMQWAGSSGTWSERLRTWMTTSSTTSPRR